MFSPIKRRGSDSLKHLWWKLWKEAVINSDKIAVFIGVEKEVPYNIYSIAKFDFMDSQSCSTQEEAPIVYGFLCEQTNVFYAFENKEQYQEFMDWLAA